MPPSATDQSGASGPVRERLRKSADYAHVQAGGRRVRGAHLMLVVCRGATADSRVGLTVSRKVGNAVQRNRVKRWLREAIRAMPGPRGGPWDLVLIPRAEARDLGFAALSLELADLFRRVPR